jgi:hypothetical protein
MANLVYPFPIIHQYFNDDYSEYCRQYDLVKPQLQEIKKELAELTKQRDLIREVIKEDEDINTYLPMYLEYAEEYGIQIYDIDKTKLTPEMIARCNDHRMGAYILNEYERDCPYDCHEHSDEGACGESSSHRIVNGYCERNANVYATTDGRHESVLGLISMSSGELSVYVEVEVDFS